MMMLQLLLFTVFLRATAYGAALAGYKTQGCFQDRPSRAIEPLEGQDPILDGSYEGRADAINKCYQAAKSRGYKVFAVQNGGWCASSATAEDTYDKYGASSACNADGEGGPWANEIYFIITDHEAPKLDCPNEPVLYFKIDPGKRFATVNWPFDFTDNSLAAGEPGVTQDSFTVTLKIDDEAGYKDYDTSLPKLLGIGHNTVKYTVTDPSGNSASCTFSVVVRDTEPPTCSFCPLDIIIDDAKSDQVRVDWEIPICSDNSGVPPSIESNMNSGDLLAVPGSYEVRYQVTDAEGNTDNNCSFRITLKKKACPLYSPPKNGALTCIDTDGELSCAAMCNDQYDFAFTPPFLYFCSQGTWQFFSIGPYIAALPWPDCSIIAETANPSWLRRVGLIQYHFFVGDANTTDVQDTLRGSFVDLLQSGFIPSFFCRTAQCTKKNVLVFPGET